MLRWVLCFISQIYHELSKTLKYLNMIKTFHLNYNIPGEFYGITVSGFRTLPLLILMKIFPRIFLKMYCQQSPSHLHQMPSIFISSKEIIQIWSTWTSVMALQDKAFKNWMTTKWMTTYKLSWRGGNNLHICLSLLHLYKGVQV